MIIGIVLLCSFAAPDALTDHFEFRKECNSYVYLTYNNGKLRGWMEVTSDTSRFLRHGYTYYFSAKGDTIDKTFYCYGAAQGLSYSFYENGDTAIIRRYSDGAKTGTWQYFDEQKYLSEEEIYDVPGGSPFENYQVKHYAQKNTPYFIENYENGKVNIRVIDTPVYNAYLDKKNNRSGKEIFMQNCAACHNIYKDAVGPKLAGVAQKRTRTWLKSWIKDAHGMVEAGDPAAIALFNQWDRIVMPANDFSEQEMDYLIQFLTEMNQKEGK